MKWQRSRHPKSNNKTYSTVPMYCRYILYIPAHTVLYLVPRRTSKYSTLNWKPTVVASQRNQTSRMNQYNRNFLSIYKYLILCFRYCISGQRRHVSPDGLISAQVSITTASPEKPTLSLRSQLLISLFLHER